MFFAHIFKLTHQIFLIFLMRPWLYKCKKMAVSLFFKFWPNIDSKLFYILFFLWTFFRRVLFQYFRFVMLPHLTNFWARSGLCCVKITKNSWKSTFLELFDLIMTGNLFGPPPEAVGTFKFASVRPSVHFRSQNQFIGLFWFLAQSCIIIRVRKWHFQIFPKNPVDTILAQNRSFLPIYLNPTMGFC